jgi:uncharacterized C2H2 Zn-finger protein
MFDYLSDKNILVLLKTMNSQIRYYAYSMKNIKIEFEMKSKSYKCKICGMLFLNSIELTVHEINVHVDKLYQCQSCYKILRNADEFNEHIKRVHSRSAPSLHSSVEPSSLASNNNIKKLQYARRRRRRKLG